MAGFLLPSRLPHSFSPAQLHLPGLAHLDLTGNRLTQLPASLSRCTKLASLLLGHNEKLLARGLDQPTLDLLAALPALRQLELPRSAARLPSQATEVCARLAAVAPHISEETFARY